MNPLLMAAALLGLLSVAIGAASEHVLRPSLDNETWRWVMTAIRYHQVGSLASLAIGLSTLSDIGSSRRRRLKLAGWTFILGTVLFSFSIYTAALTGTDAFTYVTPFGGFALMVAWLTIAWASLAKSDGR